MDTRITDLPLKTTPLASGDLFEISEDQGLGVFVSKKITAADITSEEYTYNIGEYVNTEGGVIFHRYKDGTTEYYLVVDVADLTTSSAWSDVTGSAIGPTAQTTWDGSSNTTAIITQAGATTGAAFLCDASTNGGKTDWYLPAIDELNLLYNNRFNVNRTLSGNSSQGVVVGADELMSLTYWSSTESPTLASNAFYFIFGGGNNPTANKGTLVSVRAVRKFSI